MDRMPAIYIKTPRRWRTLLPFFFLLLFVCLSGQASAAADGTVSGVVTNGTTGVPLAGATVTLSRFDRQAPESVDVTAVTDSSGAYRFEGVESADGFVHAVSVTYGGVLYSSSMLRVNEEPNTTSDITVYETTTDQSALVLSSRALIITGVDRDTGFLAVTDVFTFSNPSHRTVVADADGRTLRISVPSSASQVSLRPGFDFGTASVEQSTVFATSPIRPGESTPSLDYTIPYESATFSLVVQSAYPTDSFRVLVPENADLGDVSLAADSVTLLDQGAVDVSGSSYHIWSTNGLAANTQLNLEFAGLPRPSVERNRLRKVEPAVIALAALVVASAATVWVVARRGLARPRPIAVAPAAFATLDARRAELSDDLRFIEAQHDEQRIDEAAYQSERRAILEELRSISRQMRGIGDDE